MMRCLREVNVDNNTVGWYQSTLFGSFQTVELIETFMNYQENIRRCVCIVYDPSRSNQGVLALKALKLADSFMDLYKNNNFTGEKLREKNLSWVDIFEEIPIKVSNSALISAFMTELETDTPVKQCGYDRLQLSTNPFLERNMEFLIECMDDLSMEQQKFQFYYRNLSRQQAQQQAWLQKRRTENMSRKAAGEEPLPEEDPSNPVFKPIPEPSRLDSFLITNQISNYCNQINGNLSRQQAQQQAWLQKRRTENMSRKAAGEEPLPEEDPSNPVFKPIPEPSRLDSFLITNQISNYCNQINGVAGQSFSRLYLMKALHED
ncbi:eukaryotic translation initiation factor 3 subunit H [Olea europaea subsp. europaea]|nr:eukaryotic translation initiation factor 3 subunit H [Olea europaea subsp. europaea]